MTETHLTCVNCTATRSYIVCHIVQERQLRHLIVAAHPSAKSFNRAVVEAYMSALTERGHRVECRDLYAEHFDPILSARDLTAIKHERTARDIRAEQAAIRRADVLTLISPLWWSGFPAMLKGYLDRVFCVGFAYVIKRGRYLPGLSGKKGVIITTTGATRQELRSGGTLRALRTIHDEGLMQFCGIELLQHLYVSGIDPGMSRTEGQRRLASVRRFVRRTFYADAAATFAGRTETRQIGIDGMGDGYSSVWVEDVGACGSRQSAGPPAKPSARDSARPAMTDRPAAASRTERPGRRTARRIFAHQAYRRIVTGDTPETLSEFAAQLSAWFKDTYPAAPAFSAEFVEAAIADTWHRRHGVIGSEL